MHIIIGFVLLVLAFGLFHRVALGVLGVGALGFLGLVGLMLTHGGHI